MGAERDLELAESLRAQGFFVRSARLYRRVLAATRRAEPDLWLDASLGLAAGLRSLGETGEARARARVALTQARRLGRGDAVEALALELALIDRAEGRFARALPALARILARFRARGDGEGAAFALWALGGARRFAGDLAGSERDFRASLAAAARADDDAGQAYALFGLGGITRIRGDLAASERCYAEAGRRLSRTDDLFGRAYAACGLANALRQQGRLREAERLYRRSHALYSRIGDPVDLAYVDWGLGKVLLQTGRLREANDRLRRALRAFEKGREARGVTLSLLALAGLRHARGRTAEGERLFEQARRAARRAGLRTHLEHFT